MDLAPEDLQFLSIRDILRESISIPKQSPKTFSLVTLTLIFPLSLAILAQSLFTKPLIHEFDCSLISVIDIYTNLVQLYQKWTLILFQLFYFIFLFAFSLLSTAAVVFTVASLYTSKPVSFSNTLSAIPKVLKRLLITFLWVSLLMVGYNFLFLGFWILILEADREILGFVFYLVLVVLFSVVHVYTTALWHLASVVSVLEPVYGFAAMKKSYELLKGDTARAYVLVFEYLATCGVIGGFSRLVLVHGGDCFEVPVFVRIAVGGFLVGVLVIVNLVGLLLQSVFYFVCKSYHHQGIDKNALHDHLGGYLGDYVPLKSSIQMENMDVREGN